MNGFFCNSKATNNEEYKKVIQTRMTRMVFLFGIGCLTIAVSLIAKDNKAVTIGDQMLGVYTGVGTGLMFAAAILWIKNMLILKDDEKLKNSRLENADERIQEISLKAFRVAGFALLVALYGFGLIGGLFYPILVEVLMAKVSIFLFVYMIAYRIYDKSTR